MSDTTFDAERLVGATRDMIKKVHYPGQSAYPSVLLSVLKRLADGDPPWPRAIYEEIRTDEAMRLSKLQGRDLAKIDGLLVDQRLHLLSTEGDLIRPSSLNDLENRGKLPGELIFQNIKNEVLFSRQVAHNYCLTYPERMWLLTQFQPQGVPKSEVLDRCRNRFAIHRKINAVIADYTFNELKVLGLIEEVSQKKWRISTQAPSPLYAMVAVEAYLSVSGGDLSGSVETSAVEDEFSLVLGRLSTTGPRRLLGSWRSQLGATPPPLRGEAGNALVRLDSNGLCHLLACGMVDPRFAALVLRKHGAETALAELRSLMQDLVLETQERPVNAKAYLSWFS